MNAHLAVHYLDLLRHEGASTFAWEAVKTNIGAWPWQAAIAGAGAAIFYPPVRNFVRREWEHLHAKLDHNADVLHHILKHSDDIPNEDHNGVPWVDKRPERGRPSR